MKIYYNEESDFLEIMIGDSRPNYGEDITDDIVIFKDEITDESIGIGIFDIKKKEKFKVTILSNLNLCLTIN